MIILLIEILIELFTFLIHADFFFTPIMKYVRTKSEISNSLFNKKL